MKKLMIAAAAMMVVVGANAAEALWNWKSQGSGTKSSLYAEGGKSVLLYNSETPITFYLFDTANYSQQDILDGLRTDSTKKTLADFTSAKTTLLGSNSKISEVGTGDGFGYGVDTKSYNFFMAALVGDQLLISDNAFEEAVAGNSFNAENIGFNDTKSWSNTATKGSVDFGGAGWYTVVPEPTSGLLLLLGVAGLALRRRRA